MSQELGTIPEEKLAKSVDAGQMTFLLSVAAIAAALAFVFGGRVLRLPSALVLALLPVALIYLVNREPLQYAIVKPKGDKRNNLGIAFLACSIGLIIGNNGVHFVETPMLIEYAVLVGLLGCVGIYQTARKDTQFWGAMFGMLLMGAFYGWGLAATADNVPDLSNPANYTAAVIDKHEAHSGRGGTTYYLELEPWGPMQEPNDVRVSQDLYYSTVIGHPVCLELRRGLLHVQWYRIMTCSDTHDPQSAD